MSWRRQRADDEEAADHRPRNRPHLQRPAGVCRGRASAPERVLSRNHRVCCSSRRPCAKDVERATPSRAHARHPWAIDIHVGGEGTAREKLAVHRAAMAKLEEKGGHVPDSLRNRCHNPKLGRIRCDDQSSRGHANSHLQHPSAGRPGARASRPGAWYRASGCVPRSQGKRE